MIDDDAMVTGSASITIDRPVAEVFEAVTDVTRMGEWSPECTGCRWLGTDSAAVGATFEGDNVAKAGPVKLKKWTTTSEVTTLAPNETFEFVSEGYTTWRYDFEERDGSTVVTEKYSYAPSKGWQHFLYETVMRRSSSMETGMQATLDRVKLALE